MSQFKKQKDERKARQAIKQIEAEIGSLRASIQMLNKALDDVKTSIRTMIIMFSVLSQKGIINEHEIAEEQEILSDKDKNQETHERTYLRPKGEGDGS